MWSPLCEQTAQWQLNPTPDIYTDAGESTWETLARKYADTASPARWQLITPIQRGSIVVGPANLPDSILALPVINQSNEGAASSSRELTVYGPNGSPYRSAIVALYKQSGKVIGQGFTNSNGQLSVYGTEPGDTIRAASFDAGLAGSVTVNTAPNLTIILDAVGGLTLQTADNIPYMKVIPESSQTPNQINLYVALQGFGPNADPDLLITLPGSDVGYAPPLSYSPSTNTYEGVISLSATERGMGRIRTIGPVRLQSTYRLQQVLNNQDNEVYSNDGNLNLFLEKGSLLSSQAYFVVMPPGAVPGALPAGLVLIGDPYDLTASGAMVTLKHPAVLKLRYDGALVNSTTTPAGLGIYYYAKIFEIFPKSRTVIKPR
jgi:hypothetical protein